MLRGLTWHIRLSCTSWSIYTIHFNNMVNLPYFYKTLQYLWLTDIILEKGFLVFDLDQLFFIVGIFAHHLINLVHDEFFNRIALA